MISYLSSWFLDKLMHRFRCNHSCINIAIRGKTFCHTSLPLARTEWVQSVNKAFHCSLYKQCAYWFEPGAAGVRSKYANQCAMLPPSTWQSFTGSEITWVLPLKKFGIIAQSLWRTKTRGFVLAFCFWEISQVLSPLLYPSKSFRRTNGKIPDLAWALYLKPFSL